MGSQFLGEILGTMILILLGNGVVATVLLNKCKGQNSGWIVITAGWAFAVLAGVFVAAATGSPQADLNPAVTVAKMVMGGTTMNDGITRIAGEFIGAFLGSVLVFFTYYQHWAETPDAGLKLACHSTGPAIRNSFWNLVTEIVGTFVAGVRDLLHLQQDGRHRWQPCARRRPLPRGHAGLGHRPQPGLPHGLCHQPRPRPGPRIAHAILPIPGKGDSDWGYAWIPVVGPVIGAVIAAMVAKSLGI